MSCILKDGKFKGHGWEAPSPPGFHGVSSPKDSLLGPFVAVVSRVQLFVTPWTAEHQAPLSFAISQNLLKFTSIESVMLSISSSASPFSFCLQSFPASGSLPVSWFFASGGQSIGTSSTVLPMSIQGCFPLGLSGLISLQSKGLHLY